ncbi:MULTISPECIES: ESPR-type extended signal peptide-containing protein [Burkholderia]|nr:MULTISPECIES: ESPR-type extended signal peptide-containing protein [unclassified Burkholderia]
MNKNAHRLVYSRFRGMVVAVAETATAKGGDCPFRAGNAG